MNYRKTLAGLSFFILLIASLSVIGWRVFISESRPESISTPGADLVLSNAELKELKKGNLQYSLKVTEAHFNRAGHEGIIGGIDATYYHEGKEVLRLLAREGRVDTDTGDAILYGDPVVHLPRNYRLSTERLYYHGADRSFSTDREIHLVGPNLELHGRGMSVYPAEQTFAVYENIRSRVHGVDISGRRGGAN